MIQLCLGIPYGAPDDPLTLMALVHQLPPGAVFSAFSIGRRQLPYVAMAALAGGNVRVGLEDNLFLDRGVLASNGQLVERAATILIHDGRQGARAERGARAAETALSPNRRRPMSQIAEGRLHRRRRHRLRLGGALRAQRPRRRHLRSRSRDRAQARPGASPMRGAPTKSSLAPPPREGALTIAASIEEAVERRRFHPGEPAGARRSQTARADRPSNPRRRATRSSAPRPRACCRRGCKAA